MNVLIKAPAFVDRIYVVDDACPEGTGRWVGENNKDARVEVIFQEKNGGVGAAVMTGYRLALRESMDICVKVDGDDQMDLSRLEFLIRPLLRSEADYVKGNRFYYPKSLDQMPMVRVAGNATLSFISKISTGYYSIFDPTNGYTAIHRTALSMLELEKISQRFFFETDLLFRLNIIRAVVIDIPMKPIYKDEKSNLNSFGIIPNFLYGHFKNIFKRLTYSYVLRGFSVASVCIIAMVLLIVFGAAWSIYYWRQSYLTGIPATTGTVMIGALGLIGGFQFFIHFFMFDIAENPTRPLQKIFNDDEL